MFVSVLTAVCLHFKSCYVFQTPMVSTTQQDSKGLYKKKLLCGESLLEITLMTSCPKTPPMIAATGLNSEKSMGKISSGIFLAGSPYLEMMESLREVNNFMSSSRMSARGEQPSRKVVNQLFVYILKVVCLHLY